MENLYKAYKDKAQFFVVYIREAHPEPDKDKSSEAQRKAHAKRCKALGRLESNFISAICNPKSEIEGMIHDYSGH